MNRPCPAGLALLVAACAGPGAPPSSARAAEARRVSSNALREDYAGSSACKPCHAALYERFIRSPMHRMTRNADSAEIHAPFGGPAFEFKGDRVRFALQGRVRTMRLEAEGREPELYRVTRVIGGRYREDFAGVPVPSADPGGPARGLERILPVSYLLFKREWRYKGYSVMSPERAELKSGPVWQRTCIFCHNTAPQVSTLWDELYGAGAPVYQGSVSTELPVSRRPGVEVKDASRLTTAIDAELELLHASSNGAKGLKPALAAVIEATRRGFASEHLVEVGIGCEACHGGAREHVQEPSRKPAFGVHTPSFEMLGPEGKAESGALALNRTCAKCHTVLFSRYPYTWEGKSRDENPGGSHINSGEARDFLLGGCSGQMSCASCHDPHVEDSAARLRELAGRRGNALCASCHEKYRSDSARSAHSHHPAASSGSACLNCHMPQKNMGLAYQLTRYHRIGSPTDRERVYGDRPLECALCHADKSVEQITSTMERFWGKRYSRAGLERLYGDLSQNALLATLARGKPHERAVAGASAAGARLQAAVPLLVNELGNEYPLVRFFAKEALETLARRPLALDMNQSGAQIVQDARRLLGSSAGPP
jgi:predicted CXXCH cytochrome family protein